MSDLRQALTRSVADECGGPRATRFYPDSRAYEAFSLGTDERGYTRLKEPLAAASLNDALAETTSRWSWDRGDRLGVRELGHKIDRLHVYAVRRTGSIEHTRACYDNPYGRTALSYKCRLEHICTIDLNIIAGIDVIGVGAERDIFERDHRQRPEGARR